MQICQVNSGLCGEFPKADFLNDRLSSRKYFGGFFLFFLKIRLYVSSSPIRLRLESLVHQESFRAVFLLVMYAADTHRVR